MAQARDPAGVSNMLSEGGGGGGVSFGTLPGGVTLARRRPRLVVGEKLRWGAGEKLRLAMGLKLRAPAGAMRRSAGVCRRCA